MKLRLPLTLVCLLTVTLAACGSPTPTQPPATPPPITFGAAPTRRVSGNPVFPNDNIIADWKISVPAEIYDHDHLFDLVDGQADSFFAYNFEQVTTQRYENGEGTLLTVEVWQLARPADAYGLFTQSRAGEPVKMGNEGDGDPGRRLAFWQDRYYVVVTANKKVPDIQVTAFAYFVSISMPAGGERPALVSSLPPAGLTERGFIFFHEELSMQGEVWLGGNNLLGLSPATDGVVARYTLDGAAAHLLLIQYPAAEPAAAALQALRQTPDVELVAAEVKAATLAAVFGQASPSAATPLVQAALSAQP